MPEDLKKACGLDSRLLKKVMEISAIICSYMKVLVFHSARRDLDPDFRYNPPNTVYKAYEVF